MHVLTELPEDVEVGSHWLILLKNGLTAHGYAAKDEDLNFPHITLGETEDYYNGWGLDTHEHNPIVGYIQLNG